MTKQIEQESKKKSFLKILLAVFLIDHFAKKYQNGNHKGCGCLAVSGLILTAGTLVGIGALGHHLFGGKNLATQPSLVPLNPSVQKVSEPAVISKQHVCPTCGGAIEAVYE